MLITLELMQLLSLSFISFNTVVPAREHDLKAKGEVTAGINQ
jgi:hypothetical protein